jgi:hypothetical protein
LIFLSKYKRPGKGRALDISQRQSTRHKKAAPINTVAIKNDPKPASRPTFQPTYCPPITMTIPKALRIYIKK